MCSLQHGSILLGAGGEDNCRYSKQSESHSVDEIRKTILSHSSTLSEAAGRVVGFEEVAEAIKNGFL